MLETLASGLDCEALGLMIRAGMPNFSWSHVRRQGDVCSGESEGLRALAGVFSDFTLVLAESPGTLIEQSRV
ncbi:MAG: hypothetical protein ABIO70_35105 [Pseudomonadota bacterium]